MTTTSNLVHTEDLEEDQEFRFIAEEGEQDETVYVLDSRDWDDECVQPIELRYHVIGHPLVKGRSHHAPTEFVELIR